jgi:hypothetical protein
MIPRELTDLVATLATESLDSGDPPATLAERVGVNRIVGNIAPHLVELHRRGKGPSTCLVKRGDGLHPSVKVMDEHLARRILTGDTGRVLDRVVELRVEVELLSTPTAQPGAVFLFDNPKEVRAHAPNSRRRQ